MIGLKKTFTATLLATSVALSGCASGLNSMEKREYRAYKENGMLIEDKNPSLGAGLGVLPGGGSFYSGNPGLGIANLLMWPISILWDPVSGYSGSKSVNYGVTKASVRHDQNREIEALDNQLVAGEIDNSEYVRLKKKITDKYEPY